MAYDVFVKIKKSGLKPEDRIFVVTENHKSATLYSGTGESMDEAINIRDSIINDSRENVGEVKNARITRREREA